MSKQYTIYVKMEGSEPVVRYESRMGRLDTVQVEHNTGLQRTGQMTPSTNVNLHLILSEIPGLYHRVRKSYGRYICSCNNGQHCDHWKINKAV